jgi:molybdenum cofactor cytidylyltransferase
LPWPGTRLPLVLHVTQTLRDAGVGPVAVVTGEHHDLIAAALTTAGVAVLYNPRHPEGQLGSLLHGLRWAFARTAGDWVLSTLVDVPRVQGATVRALLEAPLTGAVRAVRPVHDDRHGHPVIWHRDVLPLLDAADPAQGARVVMRALASQGTVRDVEVDDAGVLVDLDTPGDYEAMTRAEGRWTDMALPDLTQLTLLAIESARTGNAHALRHALASGVPVDAPAGGDSLLTLACRHGHVEAARVLLEHGADPSMRDASGVRARDIAIAVGALEIAALLDHA